MRPDLCAVTFCSIMIGAALADAAPMHGPTGLWNRDDGRGGIRIVSCGGKLCGDIVWLKDTNGPGRIGQRVLFNMQPTAQGTWSGTAVNPEDGQSYSGTMTLAGSQLVTQGCALGGMICKTVNLTRAR